MANVLSILEGLLPFSFFTPYAFMKIHTRLLLALCCCTTVSMAQSDYPLHFDKSQPIVYSGRKLNGVTLTSVAGRQALSTGKSTTAYVDLTHKKITAKAGERFNVAFSFTTNWMHGYVYLDRGRDGEFSSEAENGVIAEGSDLMSFSFYKRYNSSGTAVENGNTIEMPSFVVPDNLSPGVYRIRFKVDWDNIDPAGALSPEDNTVTGKNGIIANGGAILDASFCVHGEHTRLSIDGGAENIVGEDGQPLREQVPFGEPLALRITPPAGKKLDVLHIRHGYGLSNEQFIHSTRQWEEKSIPGYLVRNDRFTIPTEMMEGEVRIAAKFVDVSPTEGEGSLYALNFSPGLTHTTTATTALTRVAFSAEQGGTTIIDIPVSTRKMVYQDFSKKYEKEVSVVPGDRLQISPTLTGTNPLHAYLYVDLDQDGRFLPLLSSDGLPTMTSELVAFSQYHGKNSDGQPASTASQVLTLPAMNIPSLLPEGVYRARLVFDHNSIDPAGRWGMQEEGNRIDLMGGYVVDFLLNVHAPTVKIRMTTEHGNIYSAKGALPQETPAFVPFAIRSVPVADGYELVEYTVKHGHNFDGPQFVNGNRQWEVVERNTAGTYNLSRHQVAGNLHITARFDPGPDAKYIPLFIEEFNGEDGSQPDSRYWKRSQRFPVTWARWISKAKEVVFIKDNELVCRAIATPDSEKAKGETEPMITGAIESRGMIDFKYGKVEGRVLTNPHKGNFPAFWMMPSVSVKGWPWEGEIDIWEHIDAQSSTVHTIHTNWTYNLGKKNDPPYSHTHGNVDMNRYHTYGIEWTPTTIKWTLDGKVVHTYTKHSSSEALAQGQWPFDRKFYLILNQSVGNGSWAASPDLSHTYETRFDWVRVYQTKEQNPLVGIDSQSVEQREETTDDNIYDLSGRHVSSPSKGVYICNGKVVILH